MRRSIPAWTLAMLLAISAAAPAAGQAGVVVGGGASIPVGDFGSFAGTGWMAMAGVRLGLPLIPIQFRAEGLYGQHPHDGATTDKTILYGGMVDVIFTIGPPLVPVKPYVIAGAGSLNHKFSPGNSGLPEDSEWKVVFGGGVGVQVSLMVAGLFAEIRYLRRDEIGFIPIMAGIRIGG